MSNRPTILRATVAGAAAALTLSLLPTLAAPAYAVGSPNVAFTFLTRHNPLVAGDGAVRVNPPGDLNASSALLPADHYAFSFSVDDSGDTAAYNVRTTDARGAFLDTSTGLVVVDRDGVGAVTAYNVATWTDTNPVVSLNGDKVWWMTGSSLFEYNVAARTTAEIAAGQFAPRTDSVSTPKTYEVPSWLAVSDGGTSVAVLYDRYNQADDSYLGSRVYAAVVGNAANASYDAFVAKGGDTPSSSTFVFTAEDTLLYSVDLAAGGFTTKKATLDAVHTTVTSGPGPYYQVAKAGGNWYLWQDVSGVSQVGVTSDPYLVPATFTNRPDGSSTVRYEPSVVAPPAVPATLTTPRATFSTFLNLDRSTVTTNGKAFYLAGGQYAPVGPDPVPYRNQQNFKGVLQYSLNGTTGWATARITTGTIATGPGGSYNGLTQALTRNTWFRWVHLTDLFTAGRISTVRKVSVKPTISISKAKSGSRTKVYGKIARKNGTAVLYKRSSTGKYVKITQVSISSTGTYSFGYRSLSRGTYRVRSAASTSWAENTRNFTI